MQLFAEITESVETKLGFVAERAKRDRTATFNNLMHLVNEESLKAGYQQLKKECAVGVDGTSWKEYGEGLEGNIRGLVERIEKMSYRPQAVKRVYIPKENGTQRPIGIPALEDKIVQKAMSRVMEAIYEQDFHEDSYGCRAGKSCHQALKRIDDLAMSKPINHVIEADIKGFFDNVEHVKLVEWLQVRIRDERFVRYVVRFLKAGYLEKGAFKKTERGTPQGGNISPMIANMFLHYVVDEWFEKEAKPRMKGQGYVVRYCDDFVILAQYKVDAEMILREVKQRLDDNGLTVNEDKTRVVSFGRFEKENARRTGRKANTFDFLGFTHYISVTRWGKFKVGRKTSKKRIRRSFVVMNRWLAAIRNALPLREWWKLLSVKMLGHYAYYGVSDNSRSIGVYYWRITRIVYKWLNRRSQKAAMSWEGFKKYLEKYPLPKPRIVHRFYVPYKLCESAC
jgi:group II intron reverse transcriptase/maturase